MGVVMAELVEVASGLAFPEGPIAMPDGTVILVEMFGPRLTRVHPDGTKQTIAEIAGGPNGAAMGPGNKVYLCNNGGRFTETQLDGMTFPGACTMEKYIGGRIQTVDLATGEVCDLYTECNGNPLIGFQMDHISYDNTRNVNAHIDYKTKAGGGPFIPPVVAHRAKSATALPGPSWSSTSSCGCCATFSTRMTWRPAVSGCDGAKV